MAPESRPLNLRLAALAAALMAAPAALAQIAPPPAVETATMPTDVFAIGALEPSEGALPATLWAKSAPQTLDYLLARAPARPASPAIGEALRRILLSPGAKPAGADASLGGRKLVALARAGYGAEARNIASLATSGRNDAFVAEAEAIASLLEGDAEDACRRSAAQGPGRDTHFWLRLRAFCYARAGEIDAFDLTLNLLRESGGASQTDETYFLALATKTPPKMALPVEDALQLATARAAGLPLAPEDLANADAGVVKAVALDANAEPALRLRASIEAVAMGAADASLTRRLFEAQRFEVAELGSAVEIAAARPGDLVADALLFQSIAEMHAPEFVRDKAARIALALGRADSFARAYALSALYAVDIEALEGVLVTPAEASAFALARMIAGDSVGAGAWLTAMIGLNDSVSALPEDLGAQFIDRVGQLALLDPQTAAMVARRGGVSLLTDEPAFGARYPRYDDPSTTARILEAAFDAVADGKAGQAGLAALAASAGGSTEGGEVETVIVRQGFEVAGMPELARRQVFERAMIAAFADATPPPLTPGAPSASDAPAAGAPASATAPTPAGASGGLTPRIKPPKSL